MQMTKMCAVEWTLMVLSHLQFTPLLRLHEPFLALRVTHTERQRQLLPLPLEYIVMFGNGSGTDFEALS